MTNSNEGYINDRYGWRYAFYIQVPLVALAGILGCFLVKVRGNLSSRVLRTDHSPRSQSKKRILQRSSESTSWEPSHS